MLARQLWKAVTVDEAGFLDRFVRVLEDHAVRYCLVGGQAVNAYVEPLVSLDLDIVVAAEQMAGLESLLASPFKVEHFLHSVHVSASGSDLRIQIQTDRRYASFLPYASVREVLGAMLPVARLEDVLQGRIWAVLDESRRGSKRQKDLADIARILETYPPLRERVPPQILTRLA